VDFRDPEPEPEPERIMMQEEVMPPPTPQPATTVQSSLSQVDSVRDAIVASFEQEDLDVPAFLRKRGEIM
jgi:hypothetical protein